MNSLVFLSSIAMGPRGSIAGVTAAHNLDEGESVVWHPAMTPRQVAILALQEIAQETCVQDGTQVWVYSAQPLDVRLVRQVIGREDCFVVHCPGGELAPLEYARDLALHELTRGKRCTTTT